MRPDRHLPMVSLVISCCALSASDHYAILSPPEFGICRSRRGLREAAPELGCRAATAKGFGQKTEEAGGHGKAKGRAKKAADASVDGTSRQVGAMA